MTNLFPKFSHFALVALIAGLYSLLGKLGLSLAFVNESATAVWPPTGFALAVLVLYGPRLWLGIFVGAFFVNLGTTGHLASSVGIAFGNTAEAVLGALLMRRYAGGVEAFNHPRTILKFVFLVAGFSTMVSASVGVGSLFLTGLAETDKLRAIWLTWWTGDLVSDLIVAPLLILWGSRSFTLKPRVRWGEVVLLVLALIAVGQAVFGGWFSGKTLPLMFLEIPLFFWVAFRFGQRLAVSAAFLSCVLAIIGTLRGDGPFATGDPNESLILLQLFMGILTVTMLATSAIVAEGVRVGDSLRRSEERYRSLVTASAQIVWRTDAGGDVIEDLPTWRAFTGQTEEQTKGRGWLTAVHPDDRERVARIWEQSLKTKSLHENEFRVRAADGTYRYVLARGVPIFDADGELREWIGTCRDITDRKKSEQRDAILLSLGQELSGASTAQDAGKIITEVAHNLFGWDACFIYLLDDKQRVLFPIISVDTIDGKKVTVLPVYTGTPPSALAKEVMENGAKLILRKVPVTFSNRAIAFGNTNRPSASLMYVPIRHARKVVGFFSIQSYTPDAYTPEDLRMLQALADDCGGALERIRAAEDLRLARDELRRHADQLEKRVADRTMELKETITSLESFCYTIAHDLRAPLRAVQGFASALTDDFSRQLGAEGQDFCRRIISSASNMDRLIQDLLIYGQLMHKELPLAIVNVDFVVEDVLGRFEDEIMARRATIEVHRPLPPVWAHATVVDQIISNMVSNALKFVSAEIQPRIRIWSEHQGDGHIRLTVADNGIGIPVEHHERIFRVFERLHSSAAFPGTGIGLAIVRKGVERIGGTVGIDSSAGKGSAFWVNLPAPPSGSFKGAPNF